MTEREKEGGREGGEREGGREGRGRVEVSHCIVVDSNLSLCPIV